jgi:GAF domain-containing protein
MLRNDELIGTLGLGRLRIEPFTEKEIELVTDFAAQATIALWRSPAASGSCASCRSSWHVAIVSQPWNS